MATVKPRGKKYCVVYTYFNEEGEKKQKWETFDTEKEANKRKLEVELGKLNNTVSGSVRESKMAVPDLRDECWYSEATFFRILGRRNCPQSRLL